MSVEAIVKAFDFESQTVRVELINGEPWFVAKDVAEVLEYAWSGIRTVQHVPEQWRGVESVSTPSGMQEMHILSEQGLYFFLNRSDKPKAIPVQIWIAGEVLPSIRKTGQYSVKPKTNIELLLESVQALAEQERRTLAIEAEQAALATRVATIEARADAGTTALAFVPEPDVDAGAVTRRKLIGRVVRGYCLTTGAAYNDAYRALYREYRDRFGVDLMARARNRDAKPLDVAEELDCLDALSAVAHEIFRAVPLPAGFDE
jgi:prophage antirepressor-like protein